MKRRNLIIAAVGLVLVGIPVVWWLASPLFIQEAVDEDFPFEVPSSEEIQAMSPAEAESTLMEIMQQVEDAPLADEQMEALEDSMMEMAAKMPDHEMAEELPASSTEWVVAAQGAFRDFDSFHKGTGTATIFQLGDQRVLRFENFEVTNGPDLHVLLVENVDASGRSDMGEFVDLGSLKGNVGNQNYEIPVDVDLANFNGVMIYCVPFHVIFATAPLN